MMRKTQLMLISLVFTIGTKAQVLNSIENNNFEDFHYEVLAPSKYEDFSSSVFDEKLLFVSSRPIDVALRKDQNQNRYYDLLTYDLQTKDVRKFSENLSSLKYSKFHLGPATILPDSLGIVYSRNYRRSNLDGEVNFYLIFENWRTKASQTLPFCSTSYSFQHPFYDARTRRLYFTSNLPDGPGGYDIYYSELLKDDSWGEPVLVEGVNGPRDDVFPTTTSDGKLFYSKTVTGRGLDIFSFKNGKITHVAAPFNTSGDDFLLLELNRDSVVFSQSKSSGEGYSIDIVLAWTESILQHSTPSMDSIPVLAVLKAEDYTDAESMKNKLSSFKEFIDSVWINENDFSVSVRSWNLDSSSIYQLLETNQEKTSGDDDNLGIAFKDQVEVKLASSDENSVVIALNRSAKQSVAELGKIKEALGSDYEITMVSIDGQLYVKVDGQHSQSAAAEKVSEINKNFGFESFVSNSIATSAVASDFENKISVISGVYHNPRSAQKELTLVKEWAPEAYVSNVNGKYYIVSELVNDPEEANAALKRAFDNGINGAWILRDQLMSTALPNLEGSPDLVVYFDFDSAELAGKYKSQIEGVIDEISGDITGVYLVGHTDARGSYSYNDKLSKERALAVSNYINSVTTSLAKNQELNASGERDLKNECSNGVECDEYAHFLNRRVEIWFY